MHMSHVRAHAHVHVHVTGVSPRISPLGASNLKRASCRKRGRDGTKYSRFHPTNYLPLSRTTHLAGIVTAAVFADAAHIVEEIVLLKTRITAAAADDPTE
jgi:hypothetical protein